MNIQKRRLKKLVNNLYKGFILVILSFSLFSFSVNKEEVDLWNKFALFNSDFDKFNGSNLTWFSKLIRKDRMVEVGDRFTLGSEIEYNIGIKYFDSNHKKIQFITKEYYGQWGMFTADNTYLFDSLGNTLGIGYKNVYFQCACNKNDDTKDNRVFKIVNKGFDLIEIDRTMFNQNGKPLDTTKCDNPWFESPEIFTSLDQFLKKYPMDNAVRRN